MASHGFAAAVLDRHGRQRCGQWRERLFCRQSHRQQLRRIRAAQCGAGGRPRYGPRSPDEHRAFRSVGDQIAGTGGDGGNGNAAMGGSGAFGSFGSDVIATGDDAPVTAAMAPSQGHSCMHPSQSLIRSTLPSRALMAPLTPISRTRCNSIKVLPRLPAEAAAAGAAMRRSAAAYPPLEAPVRCPTPTSRLAMLPATPALAPMRSSAGITTPATAATDTLWQPRYTSFALYDPINIAVAGYNSSAHADQSNNVAFDQAAFQMAGVGGNGGSGNAAIGGDAGALSSILGLIGSDVIATGGNSAGSGGSGHFTGSVVDLSIAIYAPINIAVAGVNSTADAHRPTTSSSIRARSRSLESVVTAATATPRSGAISSRTFWPTLTCTVEPCGIAVARLRRRAG